MHRPMEPNGGNESRPETQRRGLSRGLAFTLAALGLIGVSVVAGTGLARWLKNPPGQPKAPEPAGLKIPPRLFQNWPKPDLAIVLSGQQHGYLLPCGCSDPQYGGDERRYNFIQLLRQRGWPVAAVDLGDVPQAKGPANLPNQQGMIKYRYAMKALKEMGYVAVGLGENEAALDWFKIMGEWALNEERPAVLAANLKGVDAGDGKPADRFAAFKALYIPKAAEVPGTDLKIGVTAAIGQVLQDKIKSKDATVEFEPSRAALQRVLQQMQQARVDLPILLYHGLSTASPMNPGQKPEAIACAEFFPQFPIILCLSEEDEPPGAPEVVDHPREQTRNYVFRMGHKGKHIGVLGVYRNPQPNQPFSFRYQLVELGPEYATPKGQEGNNPVTKLMEDYTRELRDRHYLGEYAKISKNRKHLLQAMDPVKGLRNPGDGLPTYIGTEACKKCHENAYGIWLKTPHHHAYQTLVAKAKNPSLRQFDAECIVCHTVGFGYQGGFTDAVSTPKLENVGCENCHGPGSLHAKNPNDPEWRARMNQPWRGAKDEKAKVLAIDRFCQSCHDVDNDVTWKHGVFEKVKWPKIDHHNP